MDHQEEPMIRCPTRHSVCGACWFTRYRQEKVRRDKRPQGDVCCFCAERHHSGIYLIADHLKEPGLVCEGRH